MVNLIILYTWMVRIMTDPICGWIIIVILATAVIALYVNYRRWEKDFIQKNKEMYEGYYKRQKENDDN